MRDVGVLVAFGAGLLSFLSPCVLPLIPGYLSFISGYALADIREGHGKGRIVATTLAFILGFTVVFVALGLLFAGGGSVFGGAGLGVANKGIPPLRILTIAAGVLVFLLGLNLVFDFIKFLSFEKRMLPSKAPRGLAGAFLFGMAFAAGWSPCVGPILASILLVAARDADTSKALFLLGSYSLGLALPFIAAGLFFDRLKRLLDFFKRHAREVRIVSGGLLMAMGLAISLGRLAIVNSYSVRAGYELKDALAAAPDMARYFAAGFWFLLAAVTIAAAVARKRPLTRPFRLAAIVILVALGAAELASLISTPALVVNWLLFQGV